MAWATPAKTATVFARPELPPEWKDGYRDGQGTLTWPDGQTYVGEWHGGEKNGFGTTTYADGTKKEGIWRNGEYVGKRTKEE